MHLSRHRACVTTIVTFFFHRLLSEMVDDTLFHKRITLPTAEGFGEFPGRYLAALLSVEVDKGTDFLAEFCHFFLVGRPDVEFYFQYLFIHTLFLLCHSERNEV